MKHNHSFLNFSIILLFAIIFVASAQSQELEFINCNNVNAGIGIGGNLFSRLDTFHISPSDSSEKYNLFEAPKSSNKRQIYTASLWMSGRDVNGTVICVGQAEDGGDFYDGPISTAYDINYDAFYKRVFKITKAQIDIFRSLSFPTTSSQVDTSILRWPSKGNAWVASTYNVSVAKPLAPFVDVDGDGNYNPLIGDYPLICGDEAIFFVFNDVRGYHHETNSPNKLGMEVRGIAYSFIDNSSSLPFEKNAINNTVFIGYDIENKSVNDYHDFCLGTFEDPDLGCFNNDGVGCDTIRNVMFAYNRTTPDPVSNCNGEFGYGSTSVSSGTSFLNNSLYAFGYFHGIYDACSTLTNNMHGYTNDTLPFMDNHGNVTRYVFPGDPNDSLQWSENTNPSIPPGDRRIFGSITPMNFASGETKHFDLAFFTSYDSTSTMYHIVDTLKRDADIVQQFYSNQILSCRNSQIAASIKQASKENLEVYVYPNPASSQLLVDCDRNISAISLFDLQGRELFIQKTNEKHSIINVSNFAQGVYLLQIRSNEKLAVKKIVLQ